MENTVTFKAGDRVRYKDNSAYHDWHGWEGTVQHCNGTTTKAFTTKTAKYAPHGSEVRLTHTNLELIEPAFTFADIQVGDKIRRTKVYADGATEVREGVAGYKGSYYWANFGKNFILAYDPEHEALEGVTYELLERPEPPAPKLWENRKPGDQLITYSPDGRLDRIFTKRAENSWVTVFVGPEDKLRKGFPRNDVQVAAFVEESTELIEP